MRFPTMPAFSALALLATVSLSTLAPPALACGDDTEAPNKNVPADAKKLQITVGGMTCDGCATALHNALMKLDGVYEANVTYDSGKAIVAFDAKKVTPDALVNAIQAAGYKPGKPTDV